MFCFRLTQVGRSFFTPPNPRNSISLGSGMELWYGFYQSAILGWQPFLNIDGMFYSFLAQFKLSTPLLCNKYKVFQN